MKHIISLILICTMLFSAILSIPVSAKNEKYNSILIMGDSISTGYGLSGNIYTRESYSNKLKTALGSDNIENIAVDGATSKDLLSTIKNNTNKLKDKDLIIFSIGGNDYINTTVKIVSKECNIASDFFEVFAKIYSMSPTEIEKVFKSETATKYYSEMRNQYESNLSSIYSLIKSENQKAKIIALNQYNPFSGIILSDGLISIDKYAGIEICKLNNVTQKVSDEFKVSVCDTYRAFEDNGLKYTNIIKKDIHPNKAGHELIADKLMDIVINFDGKEPASPETSDSTFIYILLIVSSIYSICILANKKNKRIKNN